MTDEIENLVKERINVALSSTEWRETVDRFDENIRPKIQSVMARAFGYGIHAGLEITGKVAAAVLSESKQINRRKNMAITRAFSRMIYSPPRKKPMPDTDTQRKIINWLSKGFDEYRIASLAGCDYESVCLLAIRGIVFVDALDAPERCKCGARIIAKPCLTCELRGNN